MSLPITSSAAFPFVPPSVGARAYRTLRRWTRRRRPFLPLPKLRNLEEIPLNLRTLNEVADHGRESVHWAVTPMRQKYHRAILGLPSFHEQGGTLLFEFGLSSVICRHRHVKRSEEHTSELQSL